MGRTGKITVHGLRHTFATLLYGRTKNLLLVAKALGHSRVTTTQVYAHITDDDLEDALRKPLSRPGFFCREGVLSADRLKG
ncbi:MAG: tyrosine-type recombinase/integrase [Deltaproteobacteria bacterium]|nr:tyrosine-type recombinase/integrase [Deltaproteobacteria bacterium]